MKCKTRRVEPYEKNIYIGGWLVSIRCSGMLLRVQRNYAVLPLHSKIPTASSLSVCNEPEYAVR